MAPFAKLFSMYDEREMHQKSGLSACKFHYPRVPRGSNLFLFSAAAAERTPIFRHLSTHRQDLFLTLRNDGKQLIQFHYLEVFRMIREVGTSIAHVPRT